MLKNSHIWLTGYLKQRFSRKSCSLKPIDILFCIADHFEPRWGKVSPAKEIERVKIWLEKYPKAIAGHRDSERKPVKYTFFYPFDEYTPEVLNKLAGFCKSGIAEVEIQLHHDNDTVESLREKLERAKESFVKHGLLCRDRVAGNIKYGFIHGNWALDNSRRDGKWCGVNNELGILKETGCYADFTLPSAPSDTQTRKINSIYYAFDTPQPKSHNSGVDVETGKVPCGDLMIIQGPLALNWKERKFIVFPAIENSGISAVNLVTKNRIDLWIKRHISVKGRPEWVFIKVHTHGCQDQNLTDAYFENLGRMFTHLETKYNDGLNYRLHYVTAREMYNIIKAAEAGEAGKPDDYRDYLLVRQ